ncbi:MAG TPA: formyltransferase [Gemmatimonadaceae bacterium]|nr:formyltransferase [Gemmatimonadaceae bacterium]
MSAPRVVVFAYSDVGHAGLEFLLERGVNVVAVYSHADKPGEAIWFPSASKLAHDAGVPVHLDADLRTEKGIAELAAHAPDLLLSFYYREIIPQAALDLAPLGAFNMHGSLLPKFRGRAPVNWAVALGEKETGATLHVMTHLADAGDIVDQEKVAIGPDDTAFEVQGRVRDAGVRVLGRQLDALLGGTAPRKPQDHAAATKFGRRRPEDGRIDWTRSAADIHNLVRAVSHPYPGAFTTLGDRTLYLWRTARAPAPAPDGPPGSFHVKGDRAIAVAGDGRALEIVRAQVEGEPELGAAALAHRLAPLLTSSPTAS